MKNIEEALLETHVVLEKLKITRKYILKDAFVLGFIAIVIIVLGLYAQSAEWTEYPIFQTTIFVSAILLAIAFRPLQQYKNELASAEEKRKDLEAILKKDNMDYKADVYITEDAAGELDIKKSIKLFTIK